MNRFLRKKLSFFFIIAARSRMFSVSSSENRISLTSLETHFFPFVMKNFHIQKGKFPYQNSKIFFKIVTCSLKTLLQFRVLSFFVPCGMSDCSFTTPVSSESHCMMSICFSPDMPTSS
ncbi:hypothetical protein Droror1_Dr00010918 [Drosera rotundifolia]